MSAADPFAAANFETSFDEEAPVFAKDGRSLDGVDSGKLLPYNFRNPGFLSHADLRRLSMLHQRFVQHLSARLSTFLRMECHLKMTKFNSTTFQRFLETLAPTTHITLFQVEPLRGVSLVELGLTAGFSVADRLLGGKGRVTNSDRQLSEIELTLLEDVMQLVLSEWTQIWCDDQWVLTPQIIGHETSGRFIQTAASDSVFVAMSVEITVGEVTDQLQMGIPFSMIEQMVKKMHMTRPGGEEARQRKMSWRMPYTAIPVEVTAEWPVKEIELHEALQIKVGDVFTIPRNIVNHTNICFAGSPEYIGTVGVQDGKVAVHVTDKIIKYI